MEYMIRGFDLAFDSNFTDHHHESISHSKSADLLAFGNMVAMHRKGIQLVKIQHYIGE